MPFLVQFAGGAPVIKFALDKRTLSIGQDFNADICVQEEGIAEHHALIEIQPSQDNALAYQVVIKARQDQLMWVNEAVCEEACLQDNDWVRLGDIDFEYSAEGNFEFAEETSVAERVATPALDTRQSEPAFMPQPSQAEPDTDVAKPDLSAARQTSLQNTRFSRRLNIF